MPLRPHRCKCRHHWHYMSGVQRLALRHLQQTKQLDTDVQQSSITCKMGSLPVVGASKARLEGYAGGSLISTGGHSLQRLLLVLDELAG